jgi:hypothetical protein
MNDLLGLIDDIKTKLTSEEYKNIMNSMQGVNKRSRKSRYAIRIIYSEIVPGVDYRDCICEGCIESTGELRENVGRSMHLSSEIRVLDFECAEDNIDESSGLLTSQLEIEEIRELDELFKEHPLMNTGSGRIVVMYSDHNRAKFQQLKTRIGSMLVSAKKIVEDF